MVEQWLSTSWTGVWLVVVSTVAIFGSVIVFTRIGGLRSFSKMSAFDFASTVAIGSLMATVAVTRTSLLNGVVGLATLYAMQIAVAVARRQTQFERLVDNNPVLLMSGQQVLEDNLRRTNVTKDDVWAKLREANVTRYDQILAVVLETTGDISVLHGEGPLEPGLLEGVEDSDRLR